MGLRSALCRHYSVLQVSCHVLRPSIKRRAYPVLFCSHSQPALSRMSHAMAGQSASDKHKRQDSIDEEPRIPKRLILCFDGTGNSFQGTAGDTNIVKLLDMFDRSAPRQMHYYQPGIGTYTADGAVNLNLFGRIKRSISQTIDSGLATSFDAHVIAGYRFLMRYYGSGDRIYIFGFSRGAFTARFLARMIAHVGLLSMGNEEMVPFAYKVYQDYETGVEEDGSEAYMNAFRSYFCRHEKMPQPDASKAESYSKPEDRNTKAKMVDTGIKVHFLGLFDTVNSVGTFDVPFTKVPKVPNVLGTAEHVRHAVAIDERRVKFKAALLAQDITNKQLSTDGQPNGVSPKKEVIKEVWFPGNHGDIGGGWHPEEEKISTWWERIKRAFSEPKAKDALNAHLDKTNDKFQLSDIALKWMVDELDNLDPEVDHILWNDKKQSFMDRFAAKRTEAIKGFMHDTMTIGRGSSFWMTTMWKLMEYLPLVRRWEHIRDSETSPWKWDYRRIPLNKGETRDIPDGALFHHSVVERMEQFRHMEQFPTYSPKNQLSGGKAGWNLGEALLRTGGNGTVQLEYPVEDNKKGIQDTDRVFQIIK